MDSFSGGDSSCSCLIDWQFWDKFRRIGDRKKILNFFITSTFTAHKSLFIWCASLHRRLISFSHSLSLSAGTCIENHRRIKSWFISHKMVKCHENVDFHTISTPPPNTIIKNTLNSLLTTSHNSIKSHFQLISLIFIWGVCDASEQKKEI